MQMKHKEPLNNSIFSQEPNTNELKKHAVLCVLRVLGTPFD